MISFVARQYNWYKLEFGLTLLSQWEVLVFNSVVLLVLSALVYYSAQAVGAIL
ncbi:hypothetical protein SDRG_16137 [Saprolegnia diclina VS20]|uniref:Biopterin-dependent aromatic amino acid hydroxylase family profile domain-containing protein n=1 Tax=Saprolegnia diclina (strain VS20) TaxID=1156394 RepID=T0PKX5_SAPDV|nr:hypothetical protein SDRG_16137 [Saprolegnia diclina VS20]EQC25989.1 hypothetical protein SDRG_16137 [Saprolegnia diclina VS20]|eukprot:XP_008620557.1 hypothetical protein SDRG_16137 [Saprolegnia diclina VS20]